MTQENKPQDKNKNKSSKQVQNDPMRIKYKDWLTTAQIGEKYGVSRQAVQNWFYEGLEKRQVQFIGKRKQWIVHPQDLEKFFESRGK